MTEYINVEKREFRDWVKTKKGKYDWINPCNCPMADFAKEKYDFKSPTASAVVVRDGERGDPDYRVMHFYNDGHEMVPFFYISNHKSYRALEKALTKGIIE